MSMRVPRLLLMFSLALAACSGDPSGAAGDVRVQVTEVRTDPTLSGPDVIFKVRNESAAPVYLARCGSHVLSLVDRWEGGRWETVFSAVCAIDLAADPLELGPGEEVASSQVVHRAGAYRLRAGVVSRPGEQPEWSAVSDQFVIPE
jgi:hypothetical protein